MKLFFFTLIFLVFFTGCDQEAGQSKSITKTVDQHMVDSLIKNSDSSYVKSYRRSDFVNAFFYISKKDSSVCQMMKDSSGNIRQIIIARKNTRTFFAQYFANGQLQAELPLDEFGQYNGTAAFYYQNGFTQSSGRYVHGLKNGEWKSYDEKGKLLSTDEYDSNGQLIKPAGKN